MNPTCFAPRSLMPNLERALSEPQFGAVAETAWRTFTARAGAVAPRDAFYLLWATLDFDARPSFAERLLSDEGLNGALRQDLQGLLGSAVRLLAVERGGSFGRRLIDVLDGQVWHSALAALAPVGGLVYTRFAGSPEAPWPVGPMAVFPPGARDVLCTWLLDRFTRARVEGRVADEAEFYRQIAPALYRWWRLQRDAVERLRTVV